MGRGGNATYFVLHASTFQVFVEALGVFACSWMDRPSFAAKPSCITHTPFEVQIYIAFFLREGSNCVIACAGKRAELFTLIWKVHVGVLRRPLVLLENES